MKTKKIEIIVAASDILKEELIQIKGGNYSEPISCSSPGKVKCKKPGTDNSLTQNLSVW
ncbi:hypothetical protein [Labilibaculum filiforme]|jgi:hypothetical protein|uniref:hypothetical protein n=1 Tax=Labilibaculum filiforme TaxID=1940526 RepID=UPI0015D59903|nr:hypothetical protein [Labilibaculum filiforme]